MIRKSDHEVLRQQQREQTFEWISLNALSTLRSAWRKAKSASNGVDAAPDSD